MFTRSDYMSKKVSHQDYFAQFVTPAILRSVKGFLVVQDWPIPSKALEADKHLNQIPLRYWDNLASVLFSGFTGSQVKKKLEEADDHWFTLSTQVCILKSAVRLLAQAEQNEQEAI